MQLNPFRGDSWVQPAEFVIWHFLGTVLEILFSVQFSYGADAAHLANILRTLSIELDSPSIGLSYLILILEEILGLIFPYDPQFISSFSLYYIEKLNIYYEFP